MLKDELQLQILVSLKYAPHGSFYGPVHLVLLIRRFRYRLFSLVYSLVLITCGLFRDKVETLTEHQSRLLDRPTRNLVEVVQKRSGTIGANSILNFEHTERSSIRAFKHLENQSKLIGADAFQSAGQDFEHHEFVSERLGEIESEICSRLEDAVLRSLSFSAMESRHEAVAEAHARTFSWIFEDPKAHNQPWNHYAQCLRGGSGIYWINGKAASGKSTLMKYLVSRPDLDDFPQDWSGRSTLFRAHHFFWNTGPTPQKSQAGLLRSLLHQVLSQACKHPNDEDHLVRRVMPQMWGHLVVMRQRALQRWERLMQQKKAAWEAREAEQKVVRH